MTHEHEQDLFWHAFNYRNAHTTQAEEWWKALDKCVNDKIKAAVLAEREQCATICDNLSIEGDVKYAYLCAEAIRNREVE